MSFFSNLHPAIRSIAAASFLLMSPAAHAGIFDDDEARKAILDLRQQISSLNATVNNTLSAAQQRSIDEIAQLRKSMLELQNQIDRQKGDISQLRGDNEVLARNLAEMQIRQKDILQASEQKLQAVEQRSQAVEQKLTKLDPVKIVLDGREFMADPTEKRDFDAAFALFRAGDFVKSQKALFDFIQRYSGSGYSASALYWLGNAQYSNRDYKEAIINFRSMISKNPDHVRAPEAMLSVANCQLEMKDAKSAKKTLEDLMKTYPKSEAAFAGVERLRTLK
ncbi:MAG: tol-pal system protein YbgF [Burkholderiaceae bacterium]